MHYCRSIHKLNICVLSILISACSHLSISKGKFDVAIPPSIDGAGRKLDDNALALVSVNVNNKNKNIVSLNNMKSNGYSGGGDYSDENVPSFIVDGQYGIENGYGSISINIFN